ncbi:hypothetical protein [Chryseobacterium sp.]|uniref:hypothetical protein n=1 Tax=Chryseobacterium sp. TaxID=1871047 RepID=UPI0025BBD845|nr:hypothetical protein [Chryseobacterium sp.]
MKSQYPTYDFVCFSDLAFEFQTSDSKEVEVKIKRKLILYNLGTYDQKRVDYIRNFKNDLYQEISKSKESKYFETASKVSDYDEYSDFNFDKMINDYRKKYSKIKPSDLYDMVNYAIYLYNLK